MLSRSRMGCLAGLIVVATASVCLGSTQEALGEAGAGSMTERMTALMLQLAAILCAAKLGGYVAKRLHIPEVLGELGAGILIGPYLLGTYLGIFAAPVAGAFPVSPELYGIATFASIVLLYLAGLETDLSMFLRYSVVGSVVGLGGVVASFSLGAGVAVWTGLAAGYMSPGALFLGTISTATSVGITARVLSERRKLDSPEGVTVLAGAVIDDVLGIVILAIVVGMVRVAAAGGTVAWGQIGMIAAKALAFWLLCTVCGMLVARRLSKLLEAIGSRQAMATLSLGLALLLAGLSEKAGLAMIIGAYTMGLALSRVDAAHEFRHRLEPIHHTLVGVFFAVMGMLVDLHALKGVVLVGLLYTAAATVAKVLGCGLPALFMGFRPLGALRIGIGMLPRGEVALIVAGIGLAGGFIDTRTFGIAVIMTLITTLIAPLLMVRLFDERSGLRGEQRQKSASVQIGLKLPNREIAEFLLARVVQTFEQEECYTHQVAPGEPLYHVRKDDMVITVSCGEHMVELSCGENDREFARLVLLEALSGLISLFEGLQRIDARQELRAQLLD